MVFRRLWPGVAESFLALLFAVITTSSGQGCGNSLTDENGLIQRPNFTDAYNASQHCEWTIVGDTRQHVELNFSTFDVAGRMPDCTSGDYLEVFLGCKFKSIGRFCASISPPSIYSADNCMKLVFHSDDSDSKIGFQASYALRSRVTAISDVKGGCGTGIRKNVKQGIIFSPLWPRPYPQYVDCVWEVSSQENTNFKLSFYDFNVRENSPCGEYIVDVRSGINGFRYATSLLEKPKECGAEEPFSIQIKSNIMYIHFTSGESVGHQHGFAAGYVAYELQDDTSSNAQVLIIFGIIFLVMFLLVGKMLLEKLCRSKSSCMDINHRKIRVRRSRRVSPENSVPPSVIANIRALSAPKKHCEAPSSSFYCEQCIAEGNPDATKPDILKTRSNVEPSSKSVGLHLGTPTKKWRALKPLRKDRESR